MGIMKIVAELESSAEFRDWRKKNKEAKLCSAFILIGGIMQEHWMVSYYHATSDTITSFEISDIITVKPDSQVFKEGEHVKALDMAKVKIDYKEAVEIAAEAVEKKHPSATVGQTIIILQNLDAGQVWNITCITQEYKTINIRIDAATGKVASTKASSLFEFRK